MVLHQRGGQGVTARSGAGRVAIGEGRVASGPIESLVGRTVLGGLARLNLFNYSKDFQKSNQFKFAKYEHGTSGTSKFLKLCMLEYNFRRNIFPSGSSSNSQHNMNYKFRDPNKVVFGLNFKGVQTLHKNFRKFTKNLSWHGLQYCEFRLTHLY
jgi:hypothetical protein